MTQPEPDAPPLDPGRIDPTDPGAWAWWCHELGCSPAELDAAVAEVGEHVAAVREWLARQHPAR